VIHIASVLEWALAIVAITFWGERRDEPQWRWIALAMLPALVSAMAACTWHLFDNPDALKGLVVLQAFTTLMGNLAPRRRRLEPAARRAPAMSLLPAGPGIALLESLAAIDPGPLFVISLLPYPGISARGRGVVGGCHRWPCGGSSSPWCSWP